MPSAVCSSSRRTADPLVQVGAAVPVTAVIVNNGTKADQLTGITSSAFSSWGAFKTIGEGDAVAAAAEQTDPTPNPGGPSLPTPITTVAIAPGSRTSCGVPDATGELLLMHLKSACSPARPSCLTFTFANAGSVTVRVPVGLSLRPGHLGDPGPDVLRGRGLTRGRAQLSAPGDTVGR